MTEHSTEQEKFWAGDFGNDYIDRNRIGPLLTARTALWARMLRGCHGVSRVMELGCNIGLNLESLKSIRPDLALSAIEINAKAVEQASRIEGVSVRQGSIIEPFDEPEKHDLTFTSGVLIHINPDYLSVAYRNLVENSRRYVMVVEYYNPAPVVVPYRGNQDRLFKRDFAGEIMDQHGLNLVDYGFVYKRDNWVAQDDINWFLLEKPRD